MQDALGIARLLNQRHLGPQPVGAQEIIGDAQMPVVARVEQTETAVRPEFEKGGADRFGLSYGR